MQSLTQFQDELIQKLDQIDQIGKHKRRSRAAACRNARKTLQKQGYTEPQALAIVQDAKDIQQLNQECT